MTAIMDTRYYKLPLELGICPEILGPRIQLIVSVRAKAFETGLYFVVIV